MLQFRRGFYRFCAFFVIMRQSTRVCVCVRFPFFITRGQGITRVSMCLLFFSVSCVDRVSLKNPYTDPIGDSRSLVTTLPKDRVLFFLNGCEDLCRRIREIYLSDTSQLQETGPGTSHLVELLGQRASRTVYNSGCVIL